MSELFGLSMTYIMIALLVILAMAASSIVWVITRNRVMFFIGVRNIPRRRAQTVLIIIGLMLSTLIISTAFSIGDTVDYSITNQVYDRLQSIDEIVQASAGKDSTDPFESTTALVAARAIPQDEANRLLTIFNNTKGMDGAVSVIRAPVPVSDARSGQTEPVVILVGVDAGLIHGFESDIQTLDGRQAKLDALKPNEIYANKSAADKLDIVKGDTLQIFVARQPHEFVVKDIVKDRVLTGAVLGITQGLVLNLKNAQDLLGRPNEVDYLAISNTGGVRDGINGSQTITQVLNFRLDRSPWVASPTKQDLVDAAKRTSSFLTTFFVVLGLFSIAAGMLLIFLIFVMLSAERKVEMGMIRAIGTRRSHLVQIFMSEGMAYNTAAAAVGCALGVGVSLIMVRIMAALFAGQDLAIAFHVSARSLIVSYSLGVVLTFLTVTFSSWRIGSLNIVSAIRDTPEPMARDTRPQWEGALSAFRYAKWLVFKPTRLSQWAIGGGLLLLAPLSGALTAGLFIGAYGLYGGSALTSVLALLLGVFGVVAGALTVMLAGISLNYLFQTGWIALVLGVPLILLGLATGRAAPYTAGVSLVVLGTAVTLVMLRFQQRLIFTTMGLVLLVFWLLSAGDRIPPHLDGGIEMFFLSGVTMVLAATFVLVFNADVMLGVLTRAGNASSTLIPSIRTAVAYPLANKFRTGMTVAMISLVMFALVMISTINSNFSRIFLSDDALGGYDVVVSENPTNPIPDLPAAISDAGGDAGAITQVGDVRVANKRVAQARNTPPPGKDAADFARQAIVGPTTGFLDGNAVKFQARAEGMGSDAEVWQTLATNPNTAIIDSFLLASNQGGGGSGSDFAVEGIKATDKVFKPVRIEIRDATNPNETRMVDVIGVIATRASLIYNGLYLAPGAFDSLFPKPESTVHFLKLQPGADANRAAKDIEKNLQNQGVQADSIRKLIDDARAQNQGFLYLIQGFMGIGLFVGIAAVGVIAFRTVVERRQQIGMLRAIGYTRQAVAISFIMESSFITLLGVLSGILLGILLAYQLTQADQFANGGANGFYVPWLQIIGIGSFAFVASLIMTIIPSRQASGIPIAEALRYE